MASPLGNIIGRVTQTGKYVSLAGHSHYEDTLDFTNGTQVKIERYYCGLGLIPGQQITARSFSEGWNDASTTTTVFEGESFINLHDKPFAVKNNAEYIYALSQRYSETLLGRVGRKVMRVWGHHDHDSGPSVLVQFPLKKNLVHMYTADYRSLNEEELAQLSPSPSTLVPT